MTSPRTSAAEPVAGVEVEIECPDWTVALPGALDLVLAAAGVALAGRGDGAVAILLTDDDTVRALNLRFRARDTATNVLSFPALAGPFGQLGDIALAFGVCRAEAVAQAKPLADHVRHLVIHGVLHLLGEDHQDEAEAEAMESRERALLASLGVADPYAASHG